MQKKSAHITKGLCCVEQMTYSEGWNEPLRPYTELYVTELTRCTVLHIQHLLSPSLSKRKC